MSYLASRDTNTDDFCFFFHRAFVDVSVHVGNRFVITDTAINM